MYLWKYSTQHYNSVNLFSSGLLSDVFELWYYKLISIAILPLLLKSWFNVSIINGEVNKQKCGTGLKGIPVKFVKNLSTHNAYCLVRNFSILHNLLSYSISSTLIFRLIHELMNPIPITMNWTMATEIVLSIKILKIIKWKLI